MTGRRHANGEGSIYRRKDGRYEGAIYLPTVSGIRKRFRCYGKSRQDVRNQLVTEQAKVHRGTLLPDQAWLLGPYLDYWLSEVVRTNRRPKTFESYETAVRLYLKPNLGNIRLTRLTVAQLQRYLNAELAAGRTVRTVHLIRMVLSAALTRAMREELIPRNVARLVELPAWQRKDIQPWTAEQAAEFLSAARSDPLYPAFLLLMLYGLRRGEVVGLRWSDINPDQRLLRIRQQVQRIAGQLDVGPVKTNAGKRDLPLLPAALDCLTHYASQVREQVQSGLRQPAASDLIFTTRTGQPVEPGNLLRSFDRIRAEQGLPRITLHHLRHTTATLLKNAGVAARDAQLILGHAHISTTQQIYQHADVAGQRQGLLQLERLLLTAADSSRCRHVLPSRTGAGFQLSRFQSGGPGGTRTLDILLKRSTGPTVPQGMAEVRQVQRRRYGLSLLGAAAVMFSRQTSHRRLTELLGALALESPCYQ
jgi:integrase